MISRVLIACLLVGAATYDVEAAGKTVSVKGYTRKNGTYVPPYTRAAPRTSARGFVPYSPPAVLPRDVPVDGYTKNDGTYVQPHMRHIDGIKDPKPSLSARGSSSSRVTSHRTAHRATARGLAASTKPKNRYPSRQWHATDGSVLAEGRMKSRAINILKIERADGKVVELDVEELGDDDSDWLLAVSRNPEKMRTEPMIDEEHAAIDRASKIAGGEESATE